MREYTTVEVEGIVREQMQSDLEQLLREGARQMLAVALREEVDEYIKQHQEERDEHDRREGAGFTSAILPRYARRSPSIDALIPALYLKGLSTSSFPEALKAILGDHVSGLSPATIVRLKQVWEKEYTVWRQRDLSGKRYAYVWVDGIYFNVRLQPDRPCVLVVVGATHDGRKELLAVVEQQCWVHKTAKVLDKMPKSLHVDAKKMIHAAHQEGGPQGLPTLPGPIRSQVQDEDVHFTFYDFPAEHWAHLRTTKPIESTFSTIRHRTRQTKGCGSRIATLTMVFKLATEAEKHWRRLTGYKLITQVFEGVPFVDGEMKKAA